jgi:probable rRNA maturation factor
MKPIQGLENQMIREKVGMVLSALACHEGELSILFADDPKITALNQTYRGKAGPTNVLAFPMTEELGGDVASGMLGDIVISVDSAARDAEETGEKLEIVVYRLLVHGILHLLGFDHELSPEDALRMEEEQDRLLKLIGEK